MVVEGVGAHPWGSEGEPPCQRPDAPQVREEGRGQARGDVEAQELVGTQYAGGLPPEAPEGYHIKTQVPAKNVARQNKQ
jgi:hypothetical protein